MRGIVPRSASPQAPGRPAPCASRRRAGPALAQGRGERVARARRRRRRRAAGTPVPAAYSVPSAMPASSASARRKARAGGSAGRSHRRSGRRRRSPPRWVMRDQRSRARARTDRARDGAVVELRDQAETAAVPLVARVVQTGLRARLGAAGPWRSSKDRRSGTTRSRRRRCGQRASALRKSQGQLRRGSLARSGRPDSLDDPNKTRFVRCGKLLFRADVSS